jgi:N-acetylglutamate synthase-like GNAT family acetyltransferase
MLSLRHIKDSEIEWVNQCYEKVGFLPSNPKNEIIVIAELNGEKVGVGRLVIVDEKNLELGGIYVLEPFRGRGIAKKLVKFLIQNIEPFQTIFCIPFEHLISFYQQYGFAPCVDFSIVPEKVLKKYHWCKEKYSNPTALLVLKNK